MQDQVAQEQKLLEEQKALKAQQDSKFALFKQKERK